MDESPRLTAYRTVVLAAKAARNCRYRGDGAATIPVVVSFGTDGRAQGVLIRSGLSNPMTRQCILSKLEGLTIPAFAGSPVTVSADVTLR
jgi:hypothetical protein